MKRLRVGEWKADGRGKGRGRCLPAYCGVDSPTGPRLLLHLNMGMRFTGACRECGGLYAVVMEIDWMPATSAM